MYVSLFPTLTWSQVALPETMRTGHGSFFACCFQKCIEGFSWILFIYLFFYFHCFVFASEVPIVACTNIQFHKYLGHFLGSEQLLCWFYNSFPEVLTENVCLSPLYVCMLMFAPFSFRHVFFRQTEKLCEAFFYCVCVYLLITHDSLKSRMLILLLPKIANTLISVATDTLATYYNSNMTFSCLLVC